MPISVNSLGRTGDVLAAWTTSFGRWLPQNTSTVVRGGAPVSSPLSPGRNSAWVTRAAGVERVRDRDYPGQ